MSMKNDTLPNEFWKHLGKFDLSDYQQPRWSILVNDNGLQCTLYWSVPGATPPSPPSSPEKEENEAKLEQISPNQHQTNNPNQNTAKTIQALLQQRIQQFQQNNKQNAFLMRNQIPIGSVQVPSRPGMKRKESSPQGAKIDPDSQLSKRMCPMGGRPPMCSSPNAPPASVLTPSVTSSSHNSTSPNQSTNCDDGALMIDEDDHHDDDSIEDILKKNKQQQESLPQIPKNLAHNLQAQIQAATKNLQMQQNKVDMASLLNKAGHLNSLKPPMMNPRATMLNSAQQLLNSLNNSVGNQSDIKDEADSDLEEIMMGDESSDADARSSIQSFKVNDLLYGSKSVHSLSANNSVVPSQGQFGNGPPTGATRPKMESFIGDRNKMMDLELLRQRFSNPLARPTLTKFVYALTRLLFTDDEIIAPLRDLDQEKIDWIFDETYRMFPGCTYPTVKNAVGQVGRTKRYRAKYALGAKDAPREGMKALESGSTSSLSNYNSGSFNILQGLPSLLSNLPTQLTQQQLTSQMQSIMSAGGEHEKEHE